MKKRTKFEGPQLDIYLAVPYSNPDPEIREKRYNAVTRLTGLMSKEGYIVFSPITHSHPVAKMTKLSGGWGFWSKIDYAFIRACKICVVYMLPGWRQSVGVQAEIKYCEEHGIPVMYIDRFNDFKEQIGGLLK